MTNVQKLTLFSSALGITGFILCALVDWKIATGVFLMLWGIKIEIKTGQ